MKVSYVVTFEKPPEATLTDCSDYVWFALLTYRGSPRLQGVVPSAPHYDPMWRLDAASITVRRQK